MLAPNRSSRRAAMGRADHGAKAMCETDKRDPGHTPARSRIARLGWFAALYVASLAVFAALVYSLRAIVPR
jgi:hypothetical protein